MRLVLGLLLPITCAAQSSEICTGVSAAVNKPVSMVFEHKRLFPLADGSHITQVTHEAMYRDSAGRTRTEHQSTGFNGTGEPLSRSVDVYDPVAYTYTTWQEGGAGSLPHVFYRSETSKGLQCFKSVAADPSTQPPVITQSMQSATRPLPSEATELLGTQDVQGFACEAKRTTTVLPPGFFGNDQPIRLTDEVCESKEFGRLLREQIDDPLSGQHTTTLQSITRGEPDHSLFQPPPDYTEEQHR